ncbi:MAG: GntR family transcriptional regulator [Kiritimatiellae bacterium]|nr:GntR family transcriptional regulator [Kiritimatiellia bacterium]
MKLKQCISDVISDALRRELKDGRFKANEVLPSVESLCQRFAVGRFAVRSALHKLRDEGFVTVTKHVGVVATGKAGHDWKGHVAFVHSSTMCSYHPQKLAVQLARSFESHGYAMHPVFLEANTDERIDVTPLVRHIHNGLSFAVVYSEFYKVTKALDAADVPYVVVDGFSRSYPNALAVVKYDMTECYAELIGALKSRRASDVLEFDFERRVDRTFKNMMFEAGINVRRELCRLNNEGPHALSDVRTIGHHAVARFLSGRTPRARLPDVIMFDDDYLASGGIVAIMEAGLRIPDDIRVVTWGNSGNEICLGRPLACIKYDPVASASAISDYVLAVLEGKRPAPPSVRPRFIPGESL